MTKDSQSRKYQFTINNPQDHNITHECIIQKLSSLSTCEYIALCDEIGKDHTFHTHAFVAYGNAKKFSTMKNLFPTSHIESCNGSNAQNRDYIFKTGKWKGTQKEDTRIEGSQEEWGTIPDDSKPRTEAEIMAKIEEYIFVQQMTPREIFAEGAIFVKNEKVVRRTFFEKKISETPYYKEVKVVYHIGEAGTGKSFHAKKLIDEYGEEEVYVATDYSNGGTATFDRYCGERILFMDEFKGNLPHSFLLMILDRYRCDIHCRYANASALWTEVHVSTIFPVEKLYSKMVDDSEYNLDPIQQLKRRVSEYVYHYKVGTEYRTFTLPANDYTDFKQLERRACDHDPDLKVQENSFKKVTDDEDVPFH